MEHADPAAKSAHSSTNRSVSKLYTLYHDQELDCVRIEGFAIQSTSELETYLADVGGLVGNMRRRRGNVRVLVDLRNSPVRTKGVVERLRRGNQQLYCAGDRVALVVDSTLMKMQLRRNLMTEYQEVFLSIDDSKSWLIAR